MLFEFKAKALGESRAFTIGGDGDLKVAPAHNSRIVEIAAFRLIDNVAPNTPALRLVKDSLVQVGRRRS